MIRAAGVLSVLAISQASREFPDTWDEFRADFDGSLTDLFGKYKGHFGKFYETDAVERSHFEIFSKRVHSVFDFNADKKNSYRKGITRYIFFLYHFFIEYV
jgi:hypothetical protein